MTTQASVLTTKPHYQILDGLRGVAAVLVVLFHLFEAHASGPAEQIINHGYLAVDFFFVLSGFVIGYAYDDRWGRMSLKDFFRRRLIRLQPMVVMGMFIGAVFFFFGSEAMFPNIGQVSVWKLMLIFVIGSTLLPVPVSMDIRGWGEMHPLNGPAWSLFFEYIANILYALVIRRFSRTLVALLVMLAGGALLHYAVTNPIGSLAGGWKLDAPQLRVGFTRLMYPFFMGLLMSRLNFRITVKYAFEWCSLLLLLALAFPRLGGTEHLWWNGLYEAFCVIVVFPLIVACGAGGQLTGSLFSKGCRFLGDVSYPLYITHYPIIYLYWNWVTPRQLAWTEVWPSTLLVALFCVMMAYACLKLYDEPVRKWLGKAFPGSGKQ